VKTKIASALLLTLLSALLSLAAIVAAPLPLMLLHRGFGRLWFLAAILIAGGLLLAVTGPAVALSFGVAALLSFVFCECERAHLGYTASVGITTLVLVGLAALVLGLAMEQTGFDPISYMRGQIDLIAFQLGASTGSKDLGLDKDSILMQMPSAFFIGLVVSIWINSLLVVRIERNLGWQSQGARMREPLLYWRLPDFFIWISLAASVAGFMDLGSPVIHSVGINVFNVAVMLYFFQGLAVTVSYMEIKRFSPIWRVIVYFLIFSQFFLMIAVIGFVDYWMEFRKKMQAPPKPEPRQLS